MLWRMAGLLRARTARAVNISSELGHGEFGSSLMLSRPEEEEGGDVGVMESPSVMFAGDAGDSKETGMDQLMQNI